jgi:hypothetical protein
LSPKNLKFLKNHLFRLSHLSPKNLKFLMNLMFRLNLLHQVLQ